MSDSESGEKTPHKKRPKVWYNQAFKSEWLNDRVKRLDKI